MKKTRLEKVPEELLDMIKEAMHARVSNRVEPIGRKWQNYPRYMRAISKHSQLKEDLKKAKFSDDERAQFGTFSIFTFMVVAFLAVVLFAGLIYAQGIIYNVMHQVGIQNDQTQSGSPLYVNMTQAADITFGTLNNSIQSLKMVALVYILSLAVLILITNALQKIHPIFYFMYILVSLLAIIFSVPISNAYFTLLNSGIFEGGLTSFTGANWFLLNLPIVVCIISILGAILLFIQLIRGSGEPQTVG